MISGGDYHRLPHKSKSHIGRTNDFSTNQVRPLPTGTRKKSTGIQAWMLMNKKGEAQVVEAGKYAIMRRTGLLARDLRVLDPLLSYPSTIMGREKAIVINLGHTKAIITGLEVLLLNSRDPTVMPFIEELQNRIQRFHHATIAQKGDVDGLNFSKEFSKFEDQDESPKVEEKTDVKNQDGSKVLPFEFVALEAITLEQEAYPTLDKLTSVLSTLNLERVRQIKSRLIEISGRVQKVKDELEHLLDDDEDMAEMYLTEKLVYGSNMNERDDMDDESSQSNFDDRFSTLSDDEGQNLENPHGNHTSSTQSYMNKNLDVKELEMLLEPYFVQIDGTLNKLSTLREYVHNTEDFINIMLDDKQNKLLQMGVMLTTATLLLTAFIISVGYLSINVRIALFNDTINGEKNWLWTAGGGSIGCIVLYLFAYSWYKYKRLI
nr:magnesium transporter mrs2-3 [Quercus suber]